MNNTTRNTVDVSFISVDPDTALSGKIRIPAYIYEGGIFPVAVHRQVLFRQDASDLNTRFGLAHSGWCITDASSGARMAHIGNKFKTVKEAIEWFDINYNEMTDRIVNRLLHSKAQTINLPVLFEVRKGEVRAI